MLWKRATGPGAFCGLLTGTLSSIGMFVWVRVNPSALHTLALSSDAQPLAESLYRMLWSWIIGVIVTLAVSAVTQAMPYETLGGLVYGCTDLPQEKNYPIVQRPAFWAVASLFVFLWLQWLFR